MALFLWLHNWIPKTGKILWLPIEAWTWLYDTWFYTPFITTTKWSSWQGLVYLRWTYCLNGCYEINSPSNSSLSQWIQSYVSDWSELVYHWVMQTRKVEQIQSNSTFIHLLYYLFQLKMQFALSKYQKHKVIIALNRFVIRLRLMFI